MSNQSNSLKTLLSQCIQLGLNIYWRFYAIAIVFSFVAGTLRFVGETMYPYFMENTTSFVIFAVSDMLLNFILFTWFTLIWTLIKLDLIHKRPLKLWQSIKQSASPRLLKRELILSILWWSPCVASAVLIFLPSLLPSGTYTIHLNPFIALIVGSSYLFGVILMIVSPLLQLRWIFSGFIMINENCSPRQAIQKSKQITGYFTYWRIAGALILTLIAIFIMLIIPYGFIVVILTMPFYLALPTAAYQIYLEKSQQTQIQADTVHV